MLFFTVQSWLCWFKQCGEMLQCPHVVAEWAVKLRGWALWLAGSSLPYINNKSYNKVKTVTKTYLCTYQDWLSRWQKKATQVMYQFMRLFVRVVSDFICQVPLQFLIYWHSFNFSFTTHIQYNTQGCSPTQGVASINKKNQYSAAEMTCFCKPTWKLAPPLFPQQKTIVFFPTGFCIDAI